MAIARRGTPTTAARTSSGTTFVLNVPTGVVDGDLLLMCIWGDGTLTITDPAGWNTVTGNPVSPTNGRGKVFWRIASSEPASYTITFGSEKWVGMMMAYSGCDATTPIRASSWKAETVAGTSHTTNSVTAVQDDWIVSFFMDRSTSSASKNTNWTATSPAIERAEVNNNTAASSPWLNLEGNDSNGVVTAGSKSNTSVSTISQANAAMWIAAIAPAAGAAPQNVNPTGIASAEAFGTPTLLVDQTVSPTGLASAEAFGTPRLDYIIFPVGIASGEAFGSPAIDTGGNINPVGIVSAEAFGTPRLDITVSPIGIPSAEAFGGLLRFDQEVRPTGIISQETFGAPTIQGGEVTSVTTRTKMQMGLGQ